MQDAMDAIGITDNMKRLPLILYKYVLYLLLSACIEPYPLDPSQFQKSIVVQGMITDQPGPYEVIVSRTIPVENQLEDKGALSGASIVIEDDQGYSEQLTEKSVGHFYTAAIQGVIGNTYTITVTTGVGSIYKSVPEKLLPVGDFSLRHEFKQIEDSTANMQITSANGFDVLIDSKVLPEQQHRVWWRSTGTYHVYTVPWDRVKLSDAPPPPRGGPPFFVPDRPDCAGHDGHPPCSCCDCWVSEYNNQTPTISDPRFIHDGEINNLKIAFVEVNRRTMYDKYYLEVEQLSVSQAVYDFWKVVSLQRTNGSSLFQTPYPPTGGNLAAITKNATAIIGYFAASSIKKKSIVMTRSDVPYHVYVIDKIDQSCLIAFSGSINKKPAFW